MRHTVNFSIVRRLFTALCLVLVAAGASAQFSGSGSGTADDPYRIYNAAQLNQVRNFLNDTAVVFSLETDIDMTDWIADNNPVQGWSPIGSGEDTFCGTFNGNGHTISNLWIKRADTNNIGLFGRTGTSCEIHDLTLADAYIEGYDNVGGFVGYSYNGGEGSYRKPIYGVIANCKFLNGVIKGRNSVGGIIGFFLTDYDFYNSTNISNCSFQNGDINGNDYVGGIVGYIDTEMETEIDGCCFQNGNINGYNEIGGIAGYVKQSSQDINFVRCYSTNCTIIGNNNLGGILGKYYGYEKNSHIEHQATPHRRIVRLSETS